MKSWALLLVLPLAACGMQADKVVINPVQGAGAFSCKEYMEIRDDLKKKNLNASDTILKTWAEGYLSGINQDFGAKTHAYRDLSGLSVEFITEKATGFCAQNPDTRLWEFMWELYSELPIVTN